MLNNEHDIISLEAHMMMQSLAAAAAREERQISGICSDVFLILTECWELSTHHTTCISRQQQQQRVRRRIIRGELSLCVVVCYYSRGRRHMWPCSYEILGRRGLQYFFVRIESCSRLDLSETSTEFWGGKGNGDEKTFFIRGGGGGGDFRRPLDADTSLSRGSWPGVANGL